MSDICAKQDCGNPIFTKYYIEIETSLGLFVVYLCAEHFSEATKLSDAIQDNKEATDG